MSRRKRYKLSMSNQAEIAFLAASDLRGRLPAAARQLSEAHPSAPGGILRRAPHGLDRADQGTTRARVPPADIQRLLEGKALADNKLLREYSTKDGDTLNLLVKPSTGRGRQHIPSAVLSPSPSAVAPPSDLPSPGSSTRSRQNSTTRDITLTLEGLLAYLGPPSSRGSVARVRGVLARGQGHAHRERERDACGVLAHEALPIVALYRSAPMLMALLPPRRPCALASAPATAYARSPPSPPQRPGVLASASAPATVAGFRSLPLQCPMRSPHATVSERPRSRYSVRAPSQPLLRLSTLAAATAPDCTRFRHSARRVRSRYSACSPPAQYPRALVATTAPDALASTSRPTALAPRPSFRVRSLLLPRPMRSPHSTAPDDTPHHSHPTVRHPACACSTNVRVRSFQPQRPRHLFTSRRYICPCFNPCLFTTLSAPSSTLIPASAFIVSTVRHAFVSLAPTNTLWLSCPRFPLQHHVFFFFLSGYCPRAFPLHGTLTHSFPLQRLRSLRLAISPPRDCAPVRSVPAPRPALLPRLNSPLAQRTVCPMPATTPARFFSRTSSCCSARARFRSRLPSYNPQPDRGPYLILQRRRGLVGLSWPLRLYVASVSCTFECALATNYSFSVCSCRPLHPLLLQGCIYSLQALWVLLTATARVLPRPLLPQRLPASPLHLSVSVAAATVSLLRLHAPGHGSPSLTLAPPCELFRPSPHLVVIAKSSDRYLYPLFSALTARGPSAYSLRDAQVYISPLSTSFALPGFHSESLSRFNLKNTAGSDSGFPRQRFPLPRPFAFPIPSHFLALLV
ncbi:hypothetical protein C8J57DRAFT_1525288 [Mycena rebaudengoi]|nr:hypothetical protein C8J57DRAFT_1525288 [Mycena rebaudengoi]